MIHAEVADAAYIMNSIHGHKALKREAIIRRLERRFGPLNSPFSWLRRDWIDYACFQYSDRTALAFQGSRDLKDWLRNLNYGFTRSPGLPGRVHRGFAEAHSIWAKQWLEKAMFHGAKESSSVIVTGHSHGAALATLAAYQLANAGMNVKLFTFGSPVVGDKAFAEAFHELVPDAVRVQNNYDLVTWINLKLPFQNAQHVGDTHHYVLSELHEYEYPKQPPWKLNDALDTLLRYDETQAILAHMPAVYEQITEAWADYKRMTNEV